MNLIDSEQRASATLLQDTRCSERNRKEKNAANCRNKSEEEIPETEYQNSRQEKRGTLDWEINDQKKWVLDYRELGVGV